MDCLKEAIYLEKKLNNNSEDKEVVKDPNEMIPKKDRKIYVRDEDP